MTYNGGKPHPYGIGDKGQRFEIRYTNEYGVQEVFGWSDSQADAYRFYSSISKHPSMSNPVIIDRQKEETND